MLPVQDILTFLLFAQPLMISIVHPWRSPLPSLKGNVIWYSTRNQETEDRETKFMANILFIVLSQHAVWLVAPTF